MQIIVTLGPSVRLVVFQFLMKTAQVPTIIPQKRASNAPPLPPVSGVEVLLSTPRLNIFPLTFAIGDDRNYKLVDAWQNPHATKWDMSFVRFVFCHKEHVQLDELFPDFVYKSDKLEDVLSDLTRDNLWATQGYLNPYYDKNGTNTGHKVLMLGCAGRVPNDMVFRDGRDENNRGIGPKVPLSTLSQSHDLTLTAGNNIVLMAAPSPFSETASSLVA